MSLSRVMEPELLDGMEAGDPRAVRARRDLVRVNWMMGHPMIWKLVLRHAHVLPHPPEVIADVGSGDGQLMLDVARHLESWQPRTLYLVDRQPVVTDRTLTAYAALGWKTRVVSADADEWIGNVPQVDVVLANLFLHHLDESSLRRFFYRVASKVCVVVACEPRRSGVALAASRLLGLAGCGAVARHDAVASVRAGFAGTELSRLWPDLPDWHLHEARIGLFTHFFLARRRPRPAA